MNFLLPEKTDERNIPALSTLEELLAGVGGEVHLDKVRIQLQKISHDCAVLMQRGVSPEEYRLQVAVQDACLAALDFIDSL